MAYAHTPYRPDLPRRESTPEERRAVTKWLLGFGAFSALTLALLALQLFQATSESTAQTSLTRVAAALTEIDLVLDHHYESLRSQAETVPPGDTLTLDDYPIAIVLSPDNVLNTSRDDLRVIILDRSADRLYLDGTGVLRELSEGSTGPGRFSAAGVAKAALDFQTEQNHQRIGVVMFVVFVIAIALCTATALACRGWGRLGVVGVLLSTSSAAILMAGGFMYLYAEGTSAGDVVREAFLQNTADLTMIAVRNGVAGVLAGLALCAIAVGGHALTRREGARVASTQQGAQV